VKVLAKLSLDTCSHIRQALAFKKDIIVSGSRRAVNTVGIDDEFAYQKSKKVEEALRELERAVIRGKTSGNSIGADDAVRTFNGLLNLITTNIYTIPSGTTLTQSMLESVIAAAWDKGAYDLDLIVCDKSTKMEIDRWVGAHQRTRPEDTTWQQIISMYESAFVDRPMRVLLSQHMPANNALILASSRLEVPPMTNRSFHFIQGAKVGDSDKGSVIGEYTCVAKGESTMARIRA
jgi:hypothetical protein